MWVTSDQHFGHENIIKLCNRPFSSVEEMDEYLIENHNRFIKKNDTVFFLGDFSWYKSYEDNLKIFDALNGKKHLIIGNHDPDIVKTLPWKSVSQYREVKYNKSKFVLFHYPITSWDGLYRGTYHLFGHEHGRLKGVGRSMDVGVDTNEFLDPYHIQTVIDLLEPRDSIKEIDGLRG